jgi:hypothetical protein
VVDQDDVHSFETRTKRTVPFPPKRAIERHIQAALRVLQFLVPVLLEINSRGFHSPDYQRYTLQHQSHLPGVYPASL